jgi:hypothetical protein
MEIQFIHVLMTQGEYRFFTVFYACLSLAGLLFVRKPSHIILFMLLPVYAVSSIGIGMAFGLGLDFSTITPKDTKIYLLGNMLIGIIFVTFAFIVHLHQK